MINSLTYDGTFDGFLTCVFTVFEEKLTDVEIQKIGKIQENIFADIATVHTDEEKANRVWKGLSNKLSVRGRHQIYYSFLSELPNIESDILKYIIHVFDSAQNIEHDFSHPLVLKLSKIVKSVGREKHRMEAFVRFRLTKDNVYFATIEPDFNVLPLVSKHFKSRYSDQQWIIYDIKRCYGLYYNLENVEIIQLDLEDNFNHFKTTEAFFKDEELMYQQLWKDYFKSTNIASRKNMKLHVQHVPKRYWKYLSEKH